MESSHKQRFISALRRRPVSGHVPHFELAFYRTAEKIGRLHPTQRLYSRWNQMSRSEQAWHIGDVAETYAQTAELYQHDAIFVHSPFPAPGDTLMDFSVAMYERPGQLNELSERRLELAAASAKALGRGISSPPPIVSTPVCRWSGMSSCTASGARRASTPEGRGGI